MIDPEVQESAASFRIVGIVVAVLLGMIAGVAFLLTF